MAPLLKETPSEAVSTLLNRLDAKFTSYSLKNLQQHPDYPSLLSINHTLDQLRIDNIAIKATYEQLQHEFPKPLLVHTNENGGTYRVVDNLDEQKVSFVNKQGKLRSQSKEEFMKTWSGVTMLVDEQTKGVEKNYARNRVKDFIDQARLPGAVIGFLLLVFYVVYFTDNLSTTFDYLFLGTKALGMIATVPLLVRLIDKQNPWAKKLCHSSKAGSKVNCASILDAPAATFLGLFAWSEIGFLYFTVLFCYLLLFSIHANVLIAGLALLAAPYTLYSVYYQWKVAQQWCRLCLAVQVVLLLELVLAIVFLTAYPLDPVGIGSIVALVLILFVVVFTYSFLKPLLAEWKSQQKQFPQLNKIKYQLEVFQALLSKSLKMDTTEITPLQLGNPEGRHKLTIISNPTCGPCADAHHKLFDLMKNKKNVSVEKVFSTNESSRGYLIAEHMLKLYQDNPRQAKEAVSAYYEAYRYDAEGWMQHYKLVEMDCIKARLVLKEHRDWCRKRGVHVTPTVLYNGQELPKEYRVEDLNYLLD